MAQFVLINAGCGPAGVAIPPYFRGENWRQIRLDVDPGVDPDIVASLTNLGAIASDSADAVWSCHALEHLFAHEVSLALREFRRVLKSDGFVYLCVPDLETIAQLVVKHGADGIAFQSGSGPITPLDMIYGHRPSIAAGGCHMAHRTGFGAQSMERAITDAGFESGAVWRNEATLDLFGLGLKAGAESAERQRRLLAELAF